MCYVEDDWEPPAGVVPPQRSDVEKVEDLMKAAQKWRISYGQLVCLPLTGRVFRGSGATRVEGKRHTWSSAISLSVAWFLQGKGKYRVSDFLEGVSRARAGLPARGDPERELGFSLDVPYQDIRHARPALASCSAQLVRDEMLCEQRVAANPKTGLQAVASWRPGANMPDFSWSTLTERPLEHVRDILRKCMPLSFGLQYCVAKPKPPKREARPEHVADAELRVEYAVTRSLSTLLYSHNRRVKLLPVAEGILYFGHHVAQSIYDYGSRVSHVPTLKTIHRILRMFGRQDIADLQAKHRLGLRIVKAIMDNVQHYLRAWQERMWRSNQLIIGTAATSVEVTLASPGAFMVADKQKEVDAGRRKDLTVYGLKALIDSQHRMSVSELHWVRALVFSIPQLARYKPIVIEHFAKTRKALPIPSGHRTQTQPLKSNGYNETIYVELLAAVHDILAQHGISKESHHRIVVLLGGDGLTYEKLLVLKNFLQHLPDDFDSLRFVHPYLELWHLIWTDLSRLCATHWGDLTLGDPSTLAKSANQISRSAPANFGKVDYYKYSDTVFLVLRARMLDCWR
jgi:hypothetical protein